PEEAPVFSPVSSGFLFFRLPFIDFSLVRCFIPHSAVICVSSYPIIDYTFVVGIIQTKIDEFMATEKQQNSHRPPTDSGMAKEEFIRVGTTLYKIVEQPKLNGGYVRKRIAWNNETLRQDYGKDYIG